MPETLVIGAGLIGLASAEALARSGVRTTLVEAGSLLAGTSSTSFAWVNSNNKNPFSYFQLNLAGLKSFQQRSEDPELRTGEPWFLPGGHLEWAVQPDHEAELEHRVERLQARGYDAEWIDREAARAMEPWLRIPRGPLRIASFPAEGCAHPAILASALGASLRRHGGRILLGHRVVSLQDDDGGVTVRTDRGERLNGDDAVIAVGRWTQHLVAELGVTVPMLTLEHTGDRTVGYLFTTTPVAAHVNGLVTTSDMNIRPAGGGRLLLQCLDLDRTARPDIIPRTDSALAETVLERLRAHVSQTSETEIERVSVGRRSIPADGLTVAGRLPGHPRFYAIATHSGVTLSLFLGQAAANELAGKREPLLAGFRPDRFEGGIPSDAPFVAAPRNPGEQ